MRKTKKKKTTNIILMLNSEKFRILPLRSAKILLCLLSSPIFDLNTVFIYLRETGKNMWGQGGAEGKWEGKADSQLSGRAGLWDPSQDLRTMTCQEWPATPIPADERLFQTSL